MLPSQKYQVLLFYAYVPIADPDGLAITQRELCARLNLRGRIIIAEEGINGTVEGTVEAAEEYVQILMTENRFAQIDFKRSVGTGAAFKKMFVRVRNEIVSSHLGERAIDPNSISGTHISAENLHEWFLCGKKFFIVDMRNEYEFMIGHFSDSILPPLKNFRDLSAILPHLEHLRGETIVTVCTGGVRCEKASGFLVANGFTNVYQLYGGIVTYMEKFPNEHFQGKLYVFDERVAIGFNVEDKNHKILTHCEHCGIQNDHYHNCSDTACHRQFICCESCVGTGNTRCPSSRGCTYKRATNLNTTYAN